MVTQAVQTGAPAPPSTGKLVWKQFVYTIGLGCCMREQKPRRIATNTTTRSVMEEIKSRDMNWSTSTLGLETELHLQSESALRSNSHITPDVRDIPLSSLESFPPPPASPPPVARPQSRPPRHGAESPILTITDYDIATGETQPKPQNSNRPNKLRRKEKKSKQSRANVSTARAWGQIDPLYGIYQREWDRELEGGKERDTATLSSSQGQASSGSGGGRCLDIRAFDFMSYGGWIVI